jgi:hypothetical protein
MSYYIQPKQNERAFLAGMTGSGKTTLAYELLKVKDYVVVHDAKGMLTWKGYERCIKLNDAMHSDSPKIIYAPDHFELDNEEKINEFFTWVYKRKNTTLYIDEVYAVTKRAEIPHYFLACLTRGREMGISTYCSSQRPKNIPQFILSESENYYVFRLLLLNDRKRITEILPIADEQLTTLKQYQFYYGTSTGEIRGPMRLDLSHR